MNDILSEFQWHSSVGINKQTFEKRSVTAIATSDKHRMAQFVKARDGSNLLVHKATKCLWQFSDDGQSLIPAFEEDILTENDLK